MRYRFYGNGQYIGSIMMTTHPQATNWIMTSIWWLEKSPDFNKNNIEFLNKVEHDMLPGNTSAEDVCNHMLEKAGISRDDYTVFDIRLQNP